MVDSGAWSIDAYHDYQRLAAGTGNVDSARLLLEYSIGPSVLGLQVSRTKRRNENELLVDAVRHSIIRCNVKQFKDLISEIGPEIYTWRLSAFSSNVDGSGDGSTLLMSAAYTGCLEIVSLILDHIKSEDVIDVDEEGLNGVTALMIAASASPPSTTKSTKSKHQLDSTGVQTSDNNKLICRQCEIIQLLVKKGGADINKKHKFAGTTALHMAAELDRVDAVTTLCQLGINASSTLSSVGSTALHTAAHAGASSRTINALIQVCLLPVNLLMNEDTTPLYLAAHHGHAHTVKVSDKIMYAILVPLLIVIVLLMKYNNDIKRRLLQKLAVM